jgi:hypothetical protein
VKTCISVTKYPGNLVRTKSSISLVFQSLMICLVAMAPARMTAQVPALWTTFLEPTTIHTLDLPSTDPDVLAISTLQGAYNQLKGSDRILIHYWNSDPYWQGQLVPSNIPQTPIPWTSHVDSAGLEHGPLKALLESYGAAIGGAIVYDPNNIESVNVATTIAGIRDAMVVSPSEIPLLTLETHQIPILVDLTDLTTVVWVGSNLEVVNDTNYNAINNPSGASGTAGWNDVHCSNCLTTSGSALRWNVPATGADTITFDPLMTDTSNPVTKATVTPGMTYIFSVQLSGSGTASLNVWDGINNVPSGNSVTLTSTPQTQQVIVTIPVGNYQYGPPQMQILGANGATVNIQNASVVDANTADDEWSYRNWMPQVPNNKMIAILNPAQFGFLRDYIIASQISVFFLSTVNQNLQVCATPGQPPTNAGTTDLMTKIISTTAHLTPVIGFVQNEYPDMCLISSLGHFVTASDLLSNQSIWGALPGPSMLTRAVAPQAVAAHNGTVYVASLVSDGDNAQYVENQESLNWTESQFLGAVPVGWTEPPGMLAFAPWMLYHYNQQLPQSNELAAGPSGVGYVTDIDSADMSTFAQDTVAAMAATGMSTVTTWFDDGGSSTGSPSDQGTLASAFQTPAHVVCANTTNCPYSVAGNTVINGQTIGYNNSPVSQLRAILETQGSLGGGYSYSPPIFIEALSNGFTISPDDLLWMGQQLALVTGLEYVFMTPSELALTEEAYKSGQPGLPDSNVQAVKSDTLLNDYPVNLVWNGSGMNQAYGVTGGAPVDYGWALASPAAGVGPAPAEILTQNIGTDTLVIPPNTGYDEWAYLPIVVPGGYCGPPLSAATCNAPYGPYLFAVTVSGNGQVYLDVYDGQNDQTTNTVTLTCTQTPCPQQTLYLNVNMAGPNGAIELRAHSQSTWVNVTFNAPSLVQVPNWSISSTYKGSPVSSSSAGGSSLSRQPFLTNNSGYTTQNGLDFIAQNGPALQFKTASNLGSDEWIQANVPAQPDTTYIFSADVAGTGTAFLHAWNGSGNAETNTQQVTLQGNAYQTLKEIVKMPSTISGQPQIRIGSPTSPTGGTIYIRNAAVTRYDYTRDFVTGFESDDPALLQSNAPDGVAPAGGLSGVSNSMLYSAGSALTHNGSNALTYSGTATGGGDHYAYMLAFSGQSIPITQNTQLSYWVYPQSPKGLEANASLSTGTNSTCVAIDLTFSDGTALREYPSVVDQYGNQMHPAHQCNHLQPDQWNYVTTNLGPQLHGKTIKNIDVGYEQVGAGMYRGYIDDILIKN